MVETQSSVRPKMSVQEQIDFLMGPLQEGTVTKSPHYIALVPLIAWVASGNFRFLGLGVVLLEAGHIYHFVYKFDAHMRVRARQVVWFR